MTHTVLAVELPGDYISGHGTCLHTCSPWYSPNCLAILLILALLLASSCIFDRDTSASLQYSGMVLFMFFMIIHPTVLWQESTCNAKDCREWPSLGSRTARIILGIRRTPGAWPSMALCLKGRYSYLCPKHFSAFSTLSLNCISTLSFLLSPTAAETIPWSLTSSSSPTWEHF